MLEQFRDMQGFKSDMIDLIKLDHPFICDIRQCSETLDSLYFVTELVSGDNLHTVLKQRKRFSEQLTKFYIA